MKHILFTLILLSTTAHAQKATVLIVDPDIDSSKLEKDYNVQRPAQPYALPDKEQRDLTLKDIKAVEKYDELKKDILFMDLKNKAPADILKKYPELSKQDLKKMLERK